MEKRIGYKINHLSYKLKREVNKLPAIVKLENISGTNSFYICYIYKAEGPVYQKDIENNFGITRSTASKVLSLMEEKELLVRTSCSDDQRLKRLELTENGKSLAHDVEVEINEFEKKLSSILGDKEEEFENILDTLLDSLGGCKKC